MDVFSKADELAQGLCTREELRSVNCLNTPSAGVERRVRNAVAKSGEIGALQAIVSLVLRILRAMRAI